MKVVTSSKGRRALLGGVTAIVALACPAGTLANVAPPTKQTLPSGAASGAVSQVRLPADPDAGITVGTGADALRVILPANAASGTARQTQRGHVTYDGAAADTAVSADQSGVAISTIAPAAGRSEQRFQYRIELPEGQSLAPQSDGSVSIRSRDGAVATIQAPWAQDSTGRFLPTSYTVDGARLTQTVNTVGAVGNVTADPHLVLHGPKVVLLPTPKIESPYLTLWFTRHETEVAYRAMIPIDSIRVGASNACSAFLGLGAVSVPVAGVITVLCAGVAGYAHDLVTNLKQAHANHTCLNVDLKPEGVGTNPLEVFELVREILTGELPLVDFNDADGPECEH